MEGRINLPRLVIAGASSGSGKTTVAVALMRALRKRGLAVAPFKCGPDYLDPTYHARAAGRPSYNLDGWMMGREAALATFARCSRGADIAVIEGVMGLFDGASPTGEEGSTAEMAKWLDAPVIAVFDASGMARTVAALAKGIPAFDPALHLAGVICNRAGSRAHLQLLREALRNPSMLGGLLARADLSFPERHLGLHTADRDVLPEATLDAWAAAAEEGLDVNALLAIARAAPPISCRNADDTPPVRERCRIGIALDEAFHFYYPDNLARLESLGARLVPFSPLHDSTLPDVHGLYLGGGYPEEHAATISRNDALRGAIRAFAVAGGPVYAECGGLMALCQAICTRDGERHPMLGLLPGVAQMRDRLVALGYVEVETREPSLLGSAGLRLRGHQFRYSELVEVPDALDRAYLVRRRRNGESTLEGYTRGSVLASYVHAHWASCPAAAQGLVESCARRVA